MATTFTPGTGLMSPADPLASTFPEAIPQRGASPVSFDTPPLPDPYLEAAQKDLAESFDRLDRAALDPGFWKPEDLAGVDNPDYVKKLTVNSAFLELSSGRSDIPDFESDMSRQLAIVNESVKTFGKAAHSEDELHAMIRERAQTRRDKSEIMRGIAESAATDALISMFEPGSTKGWKGAREKASSMNGFDERETPDYSEAFFDAKRRMSERFADFRAPLKEVWDAMKQGGAGTFSEVVKEALTPDTNAVSWLGRVAGEAMRKDAGATAFSVYSQVPDERKGDFMDALATLVTLLPKEQRPGILANLAKQGGRDIDDLARGDRDGALHFGAELLTLPTMIGVPGGTPPRFTNDQKEYVRKELLARRNFAQKVRDIERGVYDPVKSAFGDHGDPGKWESGLYGIPGVLASSAQAAIPYVGTPLTFLSMTGQAYDDLHANLIKSGASEEQATEFAYRAAPFLALPHAALEKIQAGAWMGKVSGVQKVMDLAGDTIKNRLLRAGIRSGISGTYETGTEVGQGVMTYLAQEIGHQIDTKVPGVAWRGQGGALSDLADMSVTTFVSMLPLSIVHAAGGFSKDARARAFADAGHLRRLAYGVREEDSTEIDRAAQRGPGSLNTAVDNALSRLDASSETARNARSELDSVTLREMEAAQAAAERGLSPRIVVSKDGFAVVDPETGETLGTASEREGAMRIASAHYASVRDETEGRIAYMASTLDAAAETVKADPQSTMSVELGTLIHEGNITEKEVGSMERFREQVVLEADADGQGDVVRSVLGSSKTEYITGVRETMNRIFAGATATTVVHEFGHGKRREAYAAGRITRDEELRLYRSLDTIYGAKQTKSGERVAFLKEGLADADVTSTMLDEAFSKLLEMEVLRRRSGGGKREDGTAKPAVVLSSGVVTENMKAIGRIAGEGVASKFKAFFGAIKAHFGVALTRALATKKAIRDGHLNEAELDSHLSKMLGLSEQDEFDGTVRDEAVQLLNLERFVPDETTPFSLGKAEGGIYGIAKEGNKVLRSNPAAAEDFKNAAVAETTGTEIFGEEGIPSGSKLVEIRDKVLAWAKENGVIGSHQTPALGGEVRIGKRSIKNDLSHWAGHEKIFSIAALPEMLRSAVFVQTEIDANGTRHHLLASKLSGPTGVSTVAIVVKENNGRLFYDHEFLKKEEGTPSGKLPIGSNTRGASPEGMPSAAKVVRNALAVNPKNTDASFSVSREGGSGLSAASDDRFSKAVDAVIAGTHDMSKVIEMGATPRAFELAGANQLPVTIPPSVIRKAATGKHDLPPDLIKRVPGSMRDPVFIFESESVPDALTVILDLTHYGESVLVAVHLDKKQQNHEVNSIASIYDKSNPRAIEGWIKHGMLRYVHTQKSRDWFRSRGLQLPKEGTPRGNAKLHTEAELVNPKNTESFALSPASMADSLIVGAVSRIKDPRARAAIFQNMAAKLEAARREKDQIVIGIGGVTVVSKAIPAPRETAKLRKESAYREAVLRADLEDAVNAKYQGLLENGDLVKLKAQPVHAYLADPQSNLRGRLLSPSAALARGMDFFNPAKHGDYDGVEGVSRSVFGGTLMPDQAAQELYDHGLIKEPTPDAMWDALRREAESVARMKEHADKAKTELGQARKQAKDEAKKWLKNAVQEQQKAYSPKARIVRTLSMLDAVLSVMPPEVRGKVGGHTTLARLGSDEARLRYLEDRLDKASKEVDAHIAREYRKMFAKILKKASPKREAGKKAKGKIGAIGHRFFDQVSDVIGLSERAVSERMDAIDKRLDSEHLEPAESAALAESYQILLTFGAIKNKDAAGMASAYSKADEVYSSGRNAWRTVEENRLREVSRLRGSAIASLGNPKTSDVQRSKRKSVKAVGWVKAEAIKLMSFHETVELVFGKNSELAKRWGKMVRDGMAKRTLGITLARQRWEDAIESATGKKGRAAQMQVYEMTTESTVKATIRKPHSQTLRIPVDTFFDAQSRKSLGLTNAEAAELTAQFEQSPAESRKQYLTLERKGGVTEDAVTLTDAEAVAISMTWAQDGYKDALRHHGMGEEFQKEIEAGMSPAAKSIRAHLATEYADNFPELGSLFRKMFGVDLTQVTNYAPGAFYAQNEQAKLNLDNGGVVEGGFKQAFLKERKQHMAEPRLENAFALYFDHLNQSEHWKALAEVTREMRAVLGNPEVSKALEANGVESASALREWIDAIEGNGFANREHSKLVNALLQSQAFLALNWKVATFVKNAVGAFFNSAYKMPTGAFIKGCARLISGKIDFWKVWNSPAIQNKLHAGFTPEVRAALNRGFGAKPTRRAAFLMQGMESLGTVDAVCSAVSAAIAYDYHRSDALASGLSTEQASQVALDAAAEIVARTSQPSEITDRSLRELHLQGLGKFMFMYASEARQKTAMWGIAWKNALTLQATMADVRVLVMSHLVMAPLMHAISTAFWDWRDDGDDEIFDEKHWNLKGFLIASLTGPLSGAPLLRDLFSGFRGDSSPLSTYKRAYGAGADLFKDALDDKKHDMDWYEEKIVNVLKGTTPTAGVGANIFDQAYDSYRNIAPKRKYTDD